MGERVCYRDYCPECSAQVTIVDAEWAACGAELGPEP